jgi:hypothetical protein
VTLTREHERSNTKGALERRDTRAERIAFERHVSERHSVKDTCADPRPVHEERKTGVELEEKV